jgi:rhodanese-related sulfurtransferase
MIRLILGAWMFSLFAHAAVDKSVTKKALAEFHDGTAVLLDVRENEEVAQGRVRGALVFPKSRMNTPEWEKFVASLNKEKPIYVYCRSGNRSAAVVSELKKLGFKAENAGGLRDLKREGAETQ